MAVPPKTSPDKVVGGDYFGTFLENMGVPAPPTSVPRPESTAFLILRTLGDTDRQPAQDLMKQYGIGLIHFADALTEMSAANLIQVIGQPGDELVEITPSGKRILQSIG